MPWLKYTSSTIHTEYKLGCIQPYKFWLNIVWLGSNFLFFNLILDIGVRIELIMPFWFGNFKQLLKDWDQ